MSNPSIAPFAAAGDGCVRNMAQATWAAARGNASGTLAQPTSANTFGAYVGKNGAADWDCIRGFLGFDLSAIPAGAEILSAVLSVWVTDKYDLLGSGAIGLVAGTQASTTTLATSDFSQVGSTELATRKTIASISTGAYNTITLNASGLAHLQAAIGGHAKLALRTGRDIDNTTPASTAYEGVLLYFSEQTGTANDPYLTVTYSTVRTSSDTWAWNDSGGFPSVDEADGDRQRWTPGDTWAWTDTAARYERRQRQPVLVRAEGANTLLNGAQTMSSGTITVDSTTGFPSAGTFYSYDALDASKQTAVTYTGKTATTFTGCTGGAGVSYSDNSPVAAADAESHFPSINALEDTANPRILITYTQHFAHSGGKGRICGKVSSDGGTQASWDAATERTLIAAAVNPGTWAGIYGHTCLRCADGTLFVAWYEQDLTNRTYLRSYAMRGTPDGAGWFTFDTPVQIPSPFHADSCGVGFHAFEYGGEVYLPVYGTDNSPYITYVGDSYVKLIKTSDKGATTGGWSTVGTIATEAQLSGIEGSECHIVIKPNGTWLASIRHETANRSRLLCTSSNAGVAWSGHTLGVDEHGNDPVMHLMPEGHIILQGQELRGSGGGVYGSTVTYVSTDGSTFPTAQWRQEENDATYSIGNGSQFATIADTSVPARRVLNAYSQERASQGGAQVKFQWYAVPDFPLTNDAWAWSDSASQTHALGKATADTWAWSDTAVRVGSTTAGSTSDTWAWSDGASGSVTVSSHSETTTDTWTWGGSVGPTTSRTRTTGDTWEWSSTATGEVTESTLITIHPQGMVPGTSISAYLRWEWLGPVAAKLNAGPGAAVKTTTVADDLTVTFGGLDAGEYVAYAADYPTRRLFFMVTE